MPVLTVFAGPNGSGKSSLIRRVDFEGRQNLLEPDEIARRITPKLPRQAGISAGREVLRRTAGYLRSGESFAIETTLAGNWTSAAVKEALGRSFFTRLFYVCLDNPERSIQRVRERVAQGGHDVPDIDVRRRYTRSLSNATRMLPIVHQGLVFDNSGAEPRPIFEMRMGLALNTAAEIPEWAATLLEGMR
ncbi:MAG TPA: AAA family ATPase [Bryobacteraceae bacterium]|nr:AAA family ATPase [Bryobacteraceae bacterium]